MRHGNISYPDRIPGRQEGISLSDDGTKQAEYIVRHLKNQVVDKIYCSPLERAIETAKPLSESKKIPIEIKEELIEINFGRWTGNEFLKLEENQEWKLFHTFRAGCAIPDGETMIDVQLRIIKCIAQLWKSLPDKHIAIFSHNDVIKSLIAKISGISINLMNRIAINTGSISKFEISERGEINLQYVNKTESLQLTMI
jgi:probable phosphoglycerate mutase